MIDDRVDVVIGAVGSPPGHKGIRSIDWLTVESTFVAHPICKHPQPLSNETVMQYRSVIIHDSSRHEAPMSRGILSKEHFIHIPNMAQKTQAHQLGLGSILFRNFALNNF